MILHQLESIRQQLQEALIAYSFELSEMPEGTLLRSSNKSGTRFYVGLREAGRYKRKGITRDKELVMQLARKAYLKKAIPVLRQNVKAVEDAIRRYRPFDPDAIASELTATYRSLPKEAFFDSKVESVMLNLDAIDSRKIASHAEWAAEPYEPPEYMDEGRTIITSYNDRVRSKSEAMIAEKLHEYGIPFRYEQPLQLGEHTVYPDFTFQGAGGKEFYLEFCGMMDNPHYVRSQLRKRAAYEANGINEWSNIIYVYESSNEMNMMLVDSIVRTRIIPWL